MLQKKCNESNSPPQSQYSPFGRVKFPLGIPNDPRRMCKDPCGESSQKYVQGKIPKKTVGQHKKPFAKSHQPVSSTKVAEKRSSSESGLGFLPICNNDNMENRVINYHEQAGTSFGAHLLTKSKPLHAHALDEKLKFKRNSNVENITIQRQRRLTQPSFIEEIDSEELLQLRESIADRLPPPLLRPIKRNLVHNQFLTTGNRAKEGLKYAIATNFPHLPPDPPTGSPSTRHEIQDFCGRQTHHPKLRARDLGKRLCEAPSMTMELDDLYKEYIQRCPEGDEQSKACHFLRHAPSPHHREPRRSILKEHHGSSGGSHHNHVDSTGQGHLVHFDEEIDLISRVTKINGLDSSLRDTKGRLKLLRQLGGRITETGTKDKIAPERYPLHVSKKKTIQESNPLEVNRGEQEDLEGKTANQDLARIYFTNEATRLIACANLAAVDRRTSVFKKTMRRRPSFPHFFMDRIENDAERENKRKKQDKIAALKNEMDTFDQSIKDQPESTLSTFDPSQLPSEKSLQDIKLKVEIMKRQRERDVQATVVRNRTRKSYFRRMLPCFPDLIVSDLLEYSIKRASKLSGEEMLLAADLLKVANQQNVLEGQQDLHYDNEEELLTEEEEQEERKKDKMARDILDVCLDVAIKITNYKTTTGLEPSDSLRREWTDAGLYVLNRQDSTDDGIETVEEVVCGEGTSEEDTGSLSRRTSEQSNATADDMNDASTSGKYDDENRIRCLVALNAITDQEENEVMSPDRKPIQTIEVTDCLNEDLDNALTYDGVFLPLSDCQLSHSSSETHTGSSISPSLTSTDSPGESSLACMNAQGDSSRPDGFDYNEYGGENEYFDENENGEVVGTVEVNNIEFKLTEETGTTEGDEIARVGEAEVQLFDSGRDSLDGVKQKSKDNFKLKKGESKVSTKESLKFKFSNDIEGKRSPLQRKKTAFRHRTSLDDIDDDDDDDKDDKDVVVVTIRENTLYQSPNDKESMEDEEEQEVCESDTTGEENQEQDDAQSNFDRTDEYDVHCKKKFKREKVVYEDLDNISYGMNWVEHEKKYFEHRIKDLKQLSKVWEKGLQKPPNVFTVREKNCTPYMSQLITKRLPPYNILDPQIPRPKFNLRMKCLMRKAEQAKAEQQKSAEEMSQQDFQENSERSRTFGIESETRTCSERLKGKPKKRPSWQDEIEEYECRRVEREKSQKVKVDEDYSERLGFGAFYAKDNLLYQKFIHHEKNSFDYPIEDEEEKEGYSAENVADADCVANECMEVEGGDTLKVEDAMAKLQNEQEDYQSVTTKYLEIPGEQEFYDHNLQLAQEKPYIVDETFSLSEVYNE